MRNFLRTVASLALLGAIIIAKASWSDVRSAMRSAKTPEAAIRAVSEAKEADDSDLRELLEDFQSASTTEVRQSTYLEIKNLVDAHAGAEDFRPTKGSAELAKAIKQDPLYRSEREAASANWLEKLLQRIRRPETPNPPKLPAVPPWVFVVVRIFFYLLCAVVIGALIYLITKIPWSWTSKSRAAKKRGGLLEEGEEILTEDEYMLEADRLIAEGRYREACRALYLASLLRIDAARIARFEPTQTNWEHLHRIETSRTRPEGLEFRPVTKAFDLAWYGFRANSIADVAIFQETYQAIKRFTEGVKV